jgi:hypothetical protein
MLLIPIRMYLIPRLPFTDEELAILDGPTASPFVSLFDFRYRQYYWLLALFLTPLLHFLLNLPSAVHVGLFLLPAQVDEPTFFNIFDPHASVFITYFWESLFVLTSPHIPTGHICQSLYSSFILYSFLHLLCYLIQRT